MTPDEIAQELERRWAQFEREQRERLAHMIGELTTELDDYDGEGTRTDDNA